MSSAAAVGLALCGALVPGLSPAHAASGAESAAARYAAGETARTAVTPSAAVRNHGDGSLRITIWYPAPAGASEQTLYIGAPDDPVFVAGSVAASADWAYGPARPLILMSHGFGGVARQMTWLGAAMARVGYVVVAVDHPGSSCDPAWRTTIFFRSAARRG